MHGERAEVGILKIKTFIVPKDNIKIRNELVAGYRIWHNFTN